MGTSLGLSMVWGFVHRYRVLAAADGASALNILRSGIGIDLLVGMSDCRAV